MLKHMPWNPETLSCIESDLGNTTFSRMKVIGGWLVHHSFCLKENLSESMCFVADVDHQWVITQPTVPVEVERSNVAKDFEA